MRGGMHPLEMLCKRFAHGWFSCLLFIITPLQREYTGNNSYSYNKFENSIINNIILVLLQIIIKITTHTLIIVIYIITLVLLWHFLHQFDVLEEVFRHVIDIFYINLTSLKKWFGTSSASFRRQFKNSCFDSPIESATYHLLILYRVESRWVACRTPLLVHCPISSL